MSATHDSFARPERSWHSDRFPQRKVEREIESLTWHPLPVTDAPAMQGLAINAALRDLPIRNVRQVAWDGLLDQRYSLLGIEATYTNGTARIYLVDIGSETFVVASDFWARLEPDQSPSETEAPE